MQHRVRRDSNIIDTDRAWAGLPLSKVRVTLVVPTGAACALIAIGVLDQPYQS
jgi:hypothetical protein